MNCTTVTSTPDTLYLFSEWKLKFIYLFRQAGHRYLCRQVKTCGYQTEYGATVLPSLQRESGK